jgi:filamentous hemagglutinin family protein
VTTVSLNQPAIVNWSSLDLLAGEQLNFTSGGAGYASLNLVSGGTSFIHGSITADGPFYLVNPAGVFLGPTGSITAPSVLISALTPADPAAVLAGGTTSWNGSGLGNDVFIDGAIHAGSSLLVLGGNIVIGSTARVQADAASGRVELIAGNSGIIGGPGGAGSAAGPTAGVPSSIVNQGQVVGHSVTLISQGSIANGGDIRSWLADSAGDRVLLRAVDIVHEAQGQITTRQLVTDWDLTPTLLGKVINPDDGSNPATPSTTVQLPRLSSSGTQAVTKLQPGQLNYTHLSTVNVAAMKPTAAGSKAAQTVRRRGGETASPKKKPLVKRASFFGQTK